MGVLKSPFPFVLIRLDKITQDLWKGLPVLHPMLQMGDDAYWRCEDYPALHRDEEDGDGPAYDVGIVLEWWDDDVHPEVPRVRFLGSCGSTLHYAASNLWVPEFQAGPFRYREEFLASRARGLDSCAALNKGHWASCSRPESHVGMHASLSEEYRVLTAWYPE